MCELCQTESPTKSGRIAIWDIPQYQLCTVVGTCLQINQLRKLKTRFKKSVSDMPLNSDYELHACCVSVCRSKNPLSKSITKTINQQYTQYIQQVRGSKDEAELRQLWSSRDPGDLRQLTGYYWAILTSCRASIELKNDIYGHVHMISHISGQRSMTNSRDRESRLLQMKDDLKKKDQSIKRSKLHNNQLREQVNDLESRVNTLNSANADMQATLQKSQNPSEDYKETINRQMICMDRLQTRIDQQRQEISDLRCLLEPRAVRDPDPAKATTKLTPIRPVIRSAGKRESDLGGKKILYVGGFARHRNKFQKLTEKINGCFLYHDGGVQQSIYQLDELVKRADAIFCPIDCISHSAVDRIKSLSRDSCKDCVFLRSSSLSTFKNEVAQYAARF